MPDERNIRGVAAACGGCRCAKKGTGRRCRRPVRGQRARWRRTPEGRVNRSFGGQHPFDQRRRFVGGPDADEQVLRQVADITGGRYFRAEDTSDLQAIYDAIDKLEKSQVEVQVFNRYQELAGWLMIPALLVLLIELVLSQTIFRRLP